MFSFGLLVVLVLALVQPWSDRGTVLVVSCSSTVQVLVYSWSGPGPVLVLVLV